MLGWVARRPIGQLSSAIATLVGRDKCVRVTPFAGGGPGLASGGPVVAPQRMAEQTRKRPSGTGLVQIEREEIEYIISHYLHECFEQRCVVRSSELAARMRRSNEHLSRTAPQILGRSLKDKLREGMLMEACRLLRMPDHLPIEEVWKRSGFGTRQAFFRVFKAAMAVTPARYRAANATEKSQKMRL